CLDRRLAEDAVVVVGQKLPGSVRLVEALGILREPVEEPMNGAAEAKSKPHPGNPDGGMQRAMVSAQMEGKIRRRTGEHGALGLDPAPAGEVDDLGIAGEDDAPAGLANLCAVVEVVARTERSPLKLLYDLAADHEAGTACPFAVLE